MIRNLLLKILIKCYIYIFHYIRIFQLFKGFNTPSYSKDKEKIKSKTSQFIDYLYIFFKLKILPTYYHLFCFDTKKRILFKRYVGCSLTDPYTIANFGILWGGNSIFERESTILIHDKYIFKIICEYHKLPVPASYGLYKEEEQNNIKSDLQQLMQTKDLNAVVLKPTLGAWGAGIQFVYRNTLRSSQNFQINLKGDYIIEEIIRQHHTMEKINPHSVNSIRIISFLCTDGQVELIGAMLRTSSTKFPLDNFTIGGIVIGIDIKTGRLKKEGFVNFLYRCQPQYYENTTNYNPVLKNLAAMKKNGLLKPGRILFKHPVTNTKFYNFQIPFWDELKKVTVKAQKTFHHIKSIGWDIAITPNGPTIIEGNPSWGTIGIQATNDGLLTDKNKKLFAQYGISFYE